MSWVETAKEKLFQTHPHLKDFVGFLDSHNAESPRGAVLVACAFLDDQLRQAIGAFMVDSSDHQALLEGFNAPLGTFAARIKASHCLSLISDWERDDLDKLRKIRNEFAHSYAVTFDDPMIVGLANKLHHAVPSTPDGPVPAFGKFSTAAIGLALRLVNRPHYVRLERLRKREWQY